MCACLPTYKPLRDLLAKFASTIRSTYGSSLRFLRSGQSRARFGASKGSTTGGEHSSHEDLGTQEPKAQYPQATYTPYHYPGRDHSSTVELVQAPPGAWGHHQHVAAGWHQIPAGDERPLVVPPGAIGRTTRVEVV